MRRQLAVVTMLSLAASCAEEGPSAYIDFNLVPDEQCVLSPSGDVSFYGVGLYDIADGGQTGATGCRHSYFLNLRVNSALRANRDEPLGRAEPNVLQINEVEVKLLDAATGGTIDFTTGGVSLPNPFLVTTTISLDPSDDAEPSRNVATIEAIPAAYAPLLRGNWAGGQIIAEIQMFGTTLGDVDVDFKPYFYPIQICDGCLSMCLRADILDNSLTPDDVVNEDMCRDNRGADGRICIDSGC